MRTGSGQAGGIAGGVGQDTACGCGVVSITGSVYQGIASGSRGIGVASGVGQGRGIGTVNGFVTGRIGHGRSTAAHDAEVLGTGFTCQYAVEEWVLGNLDLQVAGRIGHGFNVLTAVSAIRAGFTHDGQGLTQVFVDGVACIAGEVQAGFAQATGGIVQLATIYRIFRT